MSRTKRQKLRLAIDFGGSSTKAIGEIDDRLIPVVMSPEVIEVGTIDLDDYRQQHDLDLWHRSFVGVGDRYFAVGDLAMRLGATQALKRLKAQTAVHKVLAIVSILAQRLNLGRSFDLELGCLLPPGEFADRERLQTRLIEALADFDTPVGGRTVQLTNVQFYPEGLGIAHLYYLNRPQTGRVGVIMAGHRNISCYAMQGKQPVQKATSDLGFQSWIGLIIDRTSGYELGSLSTAVARYWTVKDKALLDEVLRHREAVEREIELEHLIKTIKSTQITYWQSIQDWLEDKFPTGIEEVMLSGGTAEVLQDDFVNFLKARLPIRADCGNRQGVFNDRAFKQIPDLKVPDGYQSRFADVYCLSQYLMSKSSTKIRSK
jgi:Actin like proteins N terminal domain